MKTFTMLAGILALTLPSIRAAELPIVSPEVHADRTVTFRIRAPSAAEVTVAGNFAPGKKLLLMKSDLGLWQATAGPFEPGIYTYTVGIGGGSFPDPGNRDLKIGGNLQSLLIINSATAAPPWQEQSGVRRGAIHDHSYQSAMVGAARAYKVWTPPDYNPNRPEPYPVLYLLHGGGDDESAWAGVGRVRQIAENLLSRGQIKPMVIVMPYGLIPDRPDTPSDTNEKRSFNIRLFTQILVHELLPEVERGYLVAHDRERRAITGLSFGGAQASHAALSHPGLFAWVGSFSASPPPSDWTEPFHAAKATATKFDLFWLACGELDRVANRAAIESEFLPLLKKNGLAPSWNVTSGGHEWKVWRDNLAEFLPLLF
jgi:enterochelin esterase family protein